MRRRTLLHVLCMQSQSRHFEDVALQLLLKGADIDAGDEDKNTPLHLAVLYNNPAVIRFLVTHGASLTVQNAAKQTPEQLARSLNIQEAVDALIACAQVPLPPRTPFVMLCLENMLTVRWEPPMSRDGVPEVTLYEAEVVDLVSGEEKSLGDRYSRNSGDGDEN